jgi:hypothetical protein
VKKAPSPANALAGAMVISTGKSSLQIGAATAVFLQSTGMQLLSVCLSVWHVLVDHNICVLMAAATAWRLWISYASQRTYQRAIMCWAGDGTAKRARRSGPAVVTSSSSEITMVQRQTVVESAGGECWWCGGSAFVVVMMMMGDIMSNQICSDFNTTFIDIMYRP